MFLGMTLRRQYQRHGSGVWCVPCRYHGVFGGYNVGNMVDADAPVRSEVEIRFPIPMETFEWSPNNLTVSTYIVRSTNTREQGLCVDRVWGGEGE